MTLNLVQDRLWKGGACTKPVPLGQATGTSTTRPSGTSRLGRVVLVPVGQAGCLYQIPLGLGKVKRDLSLSHGTSHIPTLEAFPCPGTSSIPTMERFQVLLYLISNDITLCFWSGFIHPRMRTFDRKTFPRSLFQKQTFEIRFMDSSSSSSVLIRG